MPQKFTKERLENSSRLFLEPRVDASINGAKNYLIEGRMTNFINSAMHIDLAIEHHIMINCTRAETDEIRIDCITKANNIKIRAINKLGEALVEKCGGELEYIEELD